MAGQDKDNLEFLISQYLDGQLSVRQEQDFARRLEQGAALAEELRKYQALEGHLKDVGSAQIRQVDFEAQRSSIMERLERKVLLEGTRRRVFVLRPAFLGSVAAAAAIMLAVGLSWNVLFPHRVDVGQQSQISVKVLAPVKEASQGEAVVRMSAPRLTPEEVAVRPTVKSAGRLPRGTVMVSVTPPLNSDKAENGGQNGGPMQFEFPM